MTTGSDVDRRGVKRVCPDLASGLEVVLDTPDRSYHGGTVVNISIGGACIRYRRDRGAIPTLTPGQIITLSFSNSRSAMHVQVPAKVMGRVDEDDHSDFRTIFDPGHISFLEEQLIADMFRLFNRRGANRHTPDPSEPLVVAIRVSHDTDVLDTSVNLREVRDISASARLKDVSANGIAIVCDARLDSLLCTARYVEARFALPGFPKAMRFVCKLLNRRDEDQRYHHGMSFELEHTQDFSAQQQKIVDYIGRNQVR